MLEPDLKGDIGALVAKILKEAADSLNKPDLSIEKLEEIGQANLKKYFDSKKDLDETQEIELMTPYLLSKDIEDLLKYISLDPKERTRRAFLHLNTNLRSGFSESELQLDMIDTHIKFTEVRPLGPDSGALEHWYDDRWAWACAMSVNGGKDAIQMLARQLEVGGVDGVGKPLGIRIGDELFDESASESWNNHWSAAYQEILLECIYLARTYSKEDKDIKIKALRNALDYKSPHVKNLAKTILDNPIKRTERHSIRDHQILLMYREAYITNHCNYSSPVPIDKGPFIVDFAKKHTLAKTNS